MKKWVKRLMIYLSFILLGLYFNFAFWRYTALQNIIDYPIDYWEDLANILIAMFLSFIFPFILMLLYWLVVIIMRKLRKELFDWKKELLVYYVFLSIALLPMLYLICYTEVNLYFDNVIERHPNGNKKVSVINGKIRNKDMELYRTYYNDENAIIEQTRINGKVKIKVDDSRDYVTIKCDSLDGIEFEKANLNKYYIPIIPENAMNINMKLTSSSFPNNSTFISMSYILLTNDINFNKDLELIKNKKLSDDYNVSFNNKSKDTLKVSYYYNN